MLYVWMLQPFIREYKCSVFTDSCTMMHDASSIQFNYCAVMWVLHDQGFSSCQPTKDIRHKYTYTECVVHSDATIDVRTLELNMIIYNCMSCLHEGHKLAHPKQWITRIEMLNKTPLRVRSSDQIWFNNCHIAHRTKMSFIIACTQFSL